MKLADIVSRIAIDTRKLTDYALNPDNPKGADKAIMFQRHPIREETSMIKPELFDVIETLTDLPDYGLKAGQQGTILECYNNGKFEVEFSDPDGETIVLCALSPEQFIVVWEAKTKRWLFQAKP